MSGEVTASPDTRPLRAVHRRLLTPIAIGFAAITLICAFLRDVPMLLQYVPFAASLVLFGLPHGAMDHLTPARTLGRPVTPRSILAVVGLYAVLGAIVMLGWAATPVPAFGFFIGMTWFHWGQGDRYALVAFDGARYARGLLMGAAVIVVRGGLPMLIPLLSHPGAYREVLVGAAGLFNASTTDHAAFAFQPTFRLCAGIAFAAIVMGYFVIAHLRAHDSTDRAVWRVDLVEVALLTAFFTTVPPVLAIGLYFCFWHAIRHIIRLALLDDTSANDLHAGRFGRPLRRFAHDTWPITLAAIAILVCFVVFLPRSQTDGASALGVYLVLISALTLPHVAIVTWMDYRQEPSLLIGLGAQKAPPRNGSCVR